VLQGEHEQLRLGMAHVRLGRALRELGSFEEALVATTEGARLLEPLTRESGSGVQRGRRQLAAAYNQLGTLRDDPRRALNAQERALKIQTALSEAEPRNAQLQRELAWTLGDMAFPLSELGDTGRIESNMERSVGIFERLLAQDPANASDAHSLANAEIGLGWIRAERGDFEGALASLTRALGLIEQMVETDRGSVPARDLLWRIHRQLGETTASAAAAAPASAAARGGLRAACDWFSRGRKVLVELAAGNQKYYAEDLAGLTEKVSRCELGEANALADSQ
jgi:tetratricopeptide (TPR) repeat protein